MKRFWFVDNKLIDTSVHATTVPIDSSGIDKIKRWSGLTEQSEDDRIKILHCNTHLSGYQGNIKLKNITSWWVNHTKQNKIWG